MRRPPSSSLARLAGRLLLAAIVGSLAVMAVLTQSAPVEGPDPSPFSPQSQPPDGEAARDEKAPVEYALADGHFYHHGASSANPLLGYTITGPLWQAFQAAGGAQSLGYPISRPWSDDQGRISQAFQRGILRATATDGRLAAFERVNVLDELSAAGKDGWLEPRYMVPPMALWPPDGGKPRQQVMSEHLALLDRDPAIRRVFLATSDWAERFGLPVAIKRYDQVVTIRTQRAILRHWLVDVPQAAAGAVEAIDGAALAKEAGLVPAEDQRPIVSPRYGWLRVAGRQIVDGAGQPVRIAGVNWTGFELRDFAPRGLAVRNYAEIVDRVAALGFNTVRLPFSNEMIERNPVPNQSLVAACPACQDKPALEIMDMIVDYAGQKGLRVILDNHFSAASGYGVGLWYTREYSDSVWIKDWELLAQRYRDNPTVIGYDLRNEPHAQASWGSGDPATDFRLAAERAGRAILAINPNVLIIVEGIEQFPKPEGGMDLTWWGGNLQGARQFPVRLPAERLLYSPHEYGPTLYHQSWFNQGTTPESLLAVWKHYWAYLNLEMDLPLLVGEFGTGNATSDVEDVGPGSQGQWFQAMVALLRQRDNLHWLYWTVDASDQFSLFDQGYAEVANPLKLGALQPLMSKAFRAMPSLLAAEVVVDQGGERKAMAR